MNHPAMHDPGNDAVVQLVHFEGDALGETEATQSYCVKMQTSQNHKSTTEMTLYGKPPHKCLIINVLFRAFVGNC